MTPDDSVEPTTAALTVGQLNRLLVHALSVTFPDEVWVEGEIASLRRHAASGNVYFELVDPGDGTSHDGRAVISVVLGRHHRAFVNRLLRRAGRAEPDGPGRELPPMIRMRDGVHIRIRARVELAERSGRVRLRMSSIDPAHTLGLLAAERDRVLHQLAAEGLLDHNARLPLPLLPTRLGLVTAGGSAARADFLHELAHPAHHRDGAGPAVHWRVATAPTRVQGAGADQEVAAALRSLEHHGVEVIALVRGGGARTDLLAFDSEVVARAIAHAGVPVLTGIGHETDSSVADRVAARSFKTPTACAAALAALAHQGAARPEAAWSAIRARALGVVEERSTELNRIGRRAAVTARVRLDGQSHRVEAAARRLRASAIAVLASADNRIASLAARTDAADPSHALARGWSITRTAGGRLVRDPAEADEGTELVTTVAGGELRSRVIAVPPVTGGGPPA